MALPTSTTDQHKKEKKSQKSTSTHSHEKRTIPQSLHTIILR